MDPDKPTFICGDFNAVLYAFLDCRPPNTFSSSRDSSITLAALFDDCCVLDAWHLLHPSDVSFTWSSPDRLLASCIDFIGAPSLGLLMSPRVTLYHAPSPITVLFP